MRVPRSFAGGLVLLVLASCAPGTDSGIWGLLGGAACAVGGGDAYECSLAAAETYTVAEMVRAEQEYIEATGELPDTTVAESLVTVYGADSSDSGWNDTSVSQSAAISSANSASGWSLPEAPELVHTSTYDRYSGIERRDGLVFFGRPRPLAVASHTLWASKWSDPDRYIHSAGSLSVTASEVEGTRGTIRVTYRITNTTECDMLLDVTMYDNGVPITLDLPFEVQGSRITLWTEEFVDEGVVLKAGFDQRGFENEVRVGWFGVLSDCRE